VTCFASCPMGRLENDRSTANVFGTEQGSRRFGRPSCICMRKTNELAVSTLAKTLCALFHLDEVSVSPLYDSFPCRETKLRLSRRWDAHSGVAIRQRERENKLRVSDELQRQRAESVSDISSRARAPNPLFPFARAAEAVGGIILNHSPTCNSESTCPIHIILFCESSRAPIVSRSGCLGCWDKPWLHLS
jgi:hypothetical protein